MRSFWSPNSKFWWHISSIPLKKKKKTWRLGRNSRSFLLEGGILIGKALGMRFKLNIWDVGGQKSLRSYWRNYFESTDGLIWVVDSADRRRLGDCKEELKGLLLEERLAGATLLVFANKQDLPGALSGEEIRDALDLESIKTHHWNIQWCSAVTGEKLLEGVDWLISDIASRIFTMD
ncbi:ADP-ribosylation factor-like protein 2 isoform X2 [Acropora palmata]|uniref:ADP-ribosylation factor-like protein 2 isoform X2 n=1 Tax=Acropora palmata TaxID=6131 RepID=UPI003D9FFF1D